MNFAKKERMIINNVMAGFDFVRFHYVHHQLLKEEVHYVRSFEF